MTNETVRIILFPLIIVGMTIILVFLLIKLVDLINRSIKSYLNQQFTNAQLKSLSNQLLRINLRENLILMQKVVQFSLIAVILLLLTAIGIVFYDSKDYFKEFFKIEKEKIVLRSEQAVDSILTINRNQQNFIDSLKNNNNGLVLKIDLIQKEIKNQNQTIINLQNVIKHQNEIINNLKTPVKINTN